jgi:YYY domain-containing protein
MAQGLVYFLSWWFILQILGWLSLPIVHRIFGWLPDRGYAFTKPVGLLIISYIVWLGASTRILSNDLGGIFVALLLLAAISTWLFFKDQAGKSLLVFLKKNMKLVLTVEVLFTACFALWAVLRAYAPDKIMSAGGEKFMEIGFLNAILNSRSFPPLDPWLSGFGISYYYFGYVMMAIVTRLTSVPSGVGFDLYDALLYALAACCAFGIVYNLVAGALDRRKGKALSTVGNSQPIAFGLIGALLVTSMGNLEGLFEGLHSANILPERFWQWLNIPDLASAPASGSFFPGLTNGWWWWRASRVIQDLDLTYKPIGVSPISEFPFFSFLLGDNHPHVLGLPFVMLAIAMALNVLNWQYMHEEKEKEKSAPWWNPVWFSFGGSWLHFIGYALALGALGFINTWDFPIYLVLVVLAYGTGRYYRTRRMDQKLLIKMVSLGGGLLIAAVGLYVFFYVGFHSQAGGILPYIFPPTRLPQYLVMFGTFIFITSAYLFSSLTHHPGFDSQRQAWIRTVKWWAILLGLSILLFSGILGAIAISDIGQQLASGGEVDAALRSVTGNMDLTEALKAVVTARLQDPWLMLCISAVLAAALSSLIQGLKPISNETIEHTKIQADTPSILPSELFTRLLILLGLLLTFMLDFFYLRDSFSVRVNSIFKFYFQAWVMLGCASAYGLWWFSQNLMPKVGSVVLRIFAGLFIAAGMIYPIMSFYSRVNGFNSTPNMDGASGIARNYPEDWAAVQWLLKNAATADHIPVILEAPGASYTYEGRISAFTGFPAVLGWAIHESQWRGNYDEQGKREPDIVTIYTSGDSNTTLDLLRKWQVDYVILGSPERSYILRMCADGSRRCNLATSLSKFDQSLVPVFREGSLTIYQVP